MVLISDYAGKAGEMYYRAAFVVTLKRKRVLCDIVKATARSYVPRESWKARRGDEANWLELANLGQVLIVISCIWTLW